MRKITSLRTIFIAVIMMASFVAVSAQTSFATIGALRTAIDALNLPTSGATATTSVDYTLTGEAVLTYLSTTSAGVKTLYI